MKVINYGQSYEIYPDDLKTFDSLPAKTYRINFDPMSGFSLSATNNYEKKEEKVYGNHEEKIKKVLASYKSFDRSLGIILSGDKGIGKSLFTQLLAEESIKNGMPVILVDRAIPGISRFIDSITQECLVLFDGFEKVFSDKNEKGESQSALLGLFDGTSQQKRMYAITVNSLLNLNSFMVNRPGRFHYHFRFDYPTTEEVREFLSDKLDKKYHKEIPKVELFSKKVPLNFDCLRSIAFELNAGESFQSAIKDLNIINVEPQAYELAATFTTANNEEYVIETVQRIDLFSQGLVDINFWRNGEDVYTSFDPSEIVDKGDFLYISGADVTIDAFDNDNRILKEGSSIKDIVIVKKADKKLHYERVL